MWISRPLALFASSAFLSIVDAAPSSSPDAGYIAPRRDSQTEIDTSTDSQRRTDPRADAANTTHQAIHHKAAASDELIRGVNIGGWLVLEPWMTPDVVEGTDAVDQWTFDSTPGAAAKLQTHWSSYFTQSDVQTIASWGLNAIRIPIGYWAYHNAGTPYVQGADVYLQKAIGWARSNGLKVFIDLHGLPGSQNGDMTSGHQGAVEWQTGNNLRLSISVLKTIAAKYGSAEYADVVYAIELVNEPDPAGSNNFQVTQRWTKRAFAAVKSVATNPSLQVLIHDAWMGASQWQNVGAVLNRADGESENRAPFAIDLHLYQNQNSNDGTMSLSQHVASACAWSQTAFLPPSANLPVYAGEFSAEIDICAFTNGTTIAGNVCSESGCQCSATTPIASWTEPLISATRMFVEAQLQAFESASSGWFMWSYKGPNAWSMTNAIQYGLMGKPVTQRRYPNICA